MPRISAQHEPYAIAMWDFSWLLRHQPGEAFADWPALLDALCARGYTALRIEAFPHLVAADAAGGSEESFSFPRAGWGPALWGNRWSTHAAPRQGLRDFLTACRERGVAIGLSSWFPDDASHRARRVQGVDAFIRVWDETLAFLADAELLDTVLYVDLLNEYPLWHGFSWLGAMLDTMSEPPEAGRRYNAAQRHYYNDVMRWAIARLSTRWPEIDFFASLTHDDGVPWQDMELTDFAALDKHIWFIYHPEFDAQTGYMAKIHRMPDDTGFAACRADIDAFWAANQPTLIAWMDAEMRGYAETAGQLGIPLGNTEGWGPVMWMEHPDLGWEWVKETGRICARLGAQHGYRFNCSSNFTHPQFPGIWEDVDWHREVTGIIRTPLVTG